MLEAESSLENTPGSTIEIIGVGSAKYAPGGALKRILDIALAVTGIAVRSRADRLERSPLQVPEIQVDDRQLGRRVAGPARAGQ